MSQKSEENKGSIDFTVSYNEFIRFSKQNFTEDSVPFSVKRSIKHLDGKVFKIDYSTNPNPSEYSAPLIIERPEGMLPATFDFLEPLVSTKIKGVKESEKFYNRLPSSFQYTYHLPSGDNSSEEESLNGKVFEIQFTADYYPHGVYNIKPYRPYDMPEWLWANISWDIKEKAKPYAINRLEKLKEEKDPIEMIANKMMEE